MAAVSDPRIRLAGPSDWERLSDFRCSTGAWYEDLVEQFLHQRALARTFDGRLDFRLLAFEADEESLVAVGAHHWRAHELGEAPVDGTYLVSPRLPCPSRAVTS